MHKSTKSRSYTFWIIILLALVLRLIFLFTFDNVFSHEGESYSKINLVQTWIFHGKPYPDTNFGPLHTWLIYLLVSLFGDWIWPVRIFGVLAGTATVAFFYLLVREEFDDKVAAFAALLYAVFPVHLRASPTGLAEVPYLLFFVFGLYAYYRVLHKCNNDWLWLALGALGITAAGMFRFEAWLFLPVLCLLLLKRGFLKAAVFGALCAIFPLVHMFMTWKATGNPTNFAQTSALSFLQYMPNLPMSEKAPGWIISLWKGMGAPAFVLSLIGVIYALAMRRNWTFFALFVVPFAVVQYKAMTDTMDPSLERYIVSFATILFAYAALVLVRLGGWLERKGKGWQHFAVILVVAVTSFQGALAYTQAEANRYPDDIVAVVRWLRIHAEPTDYVLPDQRFHPFVQLESRIPYARFVSLEWTPDRKALNMEAFQRLLAETAPTIVVVDYLLADDPDNMVNSNIDVFKVPREAQEADRMGLHFRRVFSQGDYVVFRTTIGEGGA